MSSANYAIFLDYFERVRDDIGEWTTQWYEGEPEPMKAVAKIAEEVGELCGAVVKRAEGRRSDEDVADEWADAMIALLGLAAIEGIDPGHQLINRWVDDVKLRQR